jgi:DNA polymerase III subunit delta'
VLLPRENPHLFGHDAAEAAFARTARSGRLPHAWLITGPAGIGKATLAYRLARRVVAGDADATRVNDRDTALFRRVAHGSEPDLFVLERTANPKTGRMRQEITVDQVRAVTAGLHETAVGQGGRAVVVDAADELNSEAANAFLKLLEEPPRGVVLLVVCQAAGRIPRTLVSRCVKLSLRPLDDTDLRAALAEAGLDTDPPIALLGLAAGAPGRFQRLQAAGFVDHYAATLSVLANADRQRSRLVEASERLAAFTAASGADLATDLLTTIVRRGAEQAAKGRLAPSLSEAEPAELAAVTSRLPLDRWLALWDKLQRLPFELDQLNVDPRQAFFLALADLAGEPTGHAVA